jgi:hypothetical protein
MQEYKAHGTACNPLSNFVYTKKYLLQTLTLLVILPFSQQNRLACSNTYVVSKNQQFYELTKISVMIKSTLLITLPLTI